MRFVWEVIAVGQVAPGLVRDTISATIGRLRAGDHSGIALDADELEPWVEDIDFVAVSEPAADGDRVSVLVDIEMRDRGLLAEQIAAVLSGGFDMGVGEALIALPGMREVTNSDRIQRPD